LLSIADDDHLPPRPSSQRAISASISAVPKPRPVMLAST
jgi:hypothetical protein